MASTLYLMENQNNCKHIHHYYLMGCYCCELLFDDCKCKTQKQEKTASLIFTSVYCPRCGKDLNEINKHCKQCFCDDRPIKQSGGA